MGFLEIVGGVTGGVEENLVEEVSTPLYAVLDLVREVSEGAHWDGFFGWVLGVTVTLGLGGDDHL